jgi:ribosome biogenesis GTPase
MTHATDEQLGWSSFFGDQLVPGEADALRLRIDAVHRGRLTGLLKSEQLEIGLPPRANTGDFAVGDWVLADALTRMLQRRLERKTLLQRPAEGRRPIQLVAANVDTLFVAASCDADFNLARLERYLAFANDAGTDPVIVLTKADTGDQAQEFERQAARLQRGVAVVAVNARSADAATALRPWCGTGSTVAIVGSSGVGKSTLVNTLLAGGSRQQQTGSVRASDMKGRHTTTGRSLHAMAGGGWVIDTPGVRSLHMKDMEEGLDVLFAEIIELAPSCKFRNCTHDHEPGCAVLAAVSQGLLDPDRLARWRKLQAETRG